MKVQNVTKKVNLLKYFFNVYPTKKAQLFGVGLGYYSNLELII